MKKNNTLMQSNPVFIAPNTLIEFEELVGIISNSKFNGLLDVSYDSAEPRSEKFDVRNGKIVGNLMTDKLKIDKLLIDNYAIGLNRPVPMVFKLFAGVPSLSARQDRQVLINYHDFINRLSQLETAVG